MKEYLQLLKKFRDERGLHEYNHEAFIKMVNQELQEVLDADNWNHRVEEMCDVCVLCFNALEQQNRKYSLVGVTHGVNVKCDRAVRVSRKCLDYCDYDIVIENMRDCITLNGYDFDKAMLETAKKINSREGAMNESTGKWTKFDSQPNAYTPNYEQCKL